MRDVPLALLRLKAEICRLSADTAGTVVREAIWRDLADCWEQLAKEAERAGLSAAFRHATEAPTKLRD
jgi:hypothetical protein